MGLIENLKESADFIRAKRQFQPQLAVTLGSGLASFVDHVEVLERIPYAEIPHFSPPSVEGHPGQLVLAQIKDIPLLILQGRIHYYEGHSMEEVVYPTRLMAQLGAKVMVLTNASGGMDPQMKPGDFMVIEDHINLTGANPLRGPNVDALGVRFPDMTEAYDKKLCAALEESFQRQSLRVSRGVYCGVAGPNYETPAEVRYLRQIGGHAVGMSTVAEAIAARHCGMKVCAVACITNLAAGLGQGSLSHEEVKEVAQKVEMGFAQALSDWCQAVFGYTASH